MRDFLQKLSEAEGYVSIHEGVATFEDGQSFVVLPVKENLAGTDVVINGNRISSEDVENLSEIRKHFAEAESDYGLLSPGAKQFLFDMHTEDTQIGHLVRWGDHNCDEAIQEILSHDRVRQPSPAWGHYG